MSDKDKIFYRIWVAAGIISLLIFLSAKFTTVNKMLTDRDLSHGDLYDMARINDFKNYVPESKDTLDWKTLPTPDSAIIMIMGDSFFQNRAAAGPLYGLISESTNDEIYFYRMGISNPLELLREYNYKKSGRRVLIIESAERYLLLRYANSDALSKSDPEQSDPLHESRGRKLRRAFDSFKENLFLNTEERLQYLLENNFLGKYIDEKKNTLLFHFFGLISRQTPVYYLPARMLFYYETVDQSIFSFYHEHTDAEIEKIAANLKTISDSLKSEYDIDLIFVPIPNKFTIYHNLISHDRYDNFLPRLYNELDENGVEYLNFYDPFVSYNDGFLYYGSDTHLNDVGKEIVLENLISELKENTPYIFKSSSVRQNR